MSPNRWIAAALALCAACLSAVLWLGPQRAWSWMPFALAVAVYALRKAQPLFSDMLCAALIALTGYAVAIGGSAWLGLPAIAGALAAWDLGRFERDLRDVPRVDDAAAQLRDHVRRLGVALGLGLALGAAALAIRISTTFGLIVLIFLAAIIIARIAIRAERRLNTHDDAPG
jgi:hypothetical protein